MGARDFNSPLSVWLQERDGDNRSLKELQKELSLKAVKVPAFVDGNNIGDAIPLSFSLPDSLVRAQNMFGMSVETAENLQGALLNERTIIDFLAESVCGPTGIVSDNRVAREFFKLTGTTLVRSMPRMSGLPLEQRKGIAKFIAFAFQQCPPERLPNPIMRVW